MRHILKTVFVIIILIIAFSCKNKEEIEFGSEIGKLKAESAPVEVGVLVLEKTKFPVELVSTGKLVAFRKADLNFQANSYIKKIYVKNGQYISKGSIIAKLDQTSILNKLKNDSLNLEKSKISYEDKLIVHDPNGDFKDIDPVVKRNISVREGYENAKLNLKTSLLDYEKTYLRAPFSGKIADIVLKEHDNPGGKAFCKLIDYTAFEIKFPILETEIESVKDGMEIKMVPYNNPEKQYFGKVTEINPVIDENGLIYMKAFVKNTDGKLFEGMNVKIFVHNLIPDCFVVPKKTVVIRNTNRDVVFLYKNGRAIWKYVKKINENSTDYIIEGESEGIINEGDTIIIKGNMNLGHDAKVVIDDIK